MTDHELLRHYAERGSQEAFAELVRRYVDLVYSAARRQLSSQDLLQDAVQLVFIDLEKNARRLNPGQPLGPWLYVVTRRHAIDLIRREARRREREAEAAYAVMGAMPDPWTRLEPMLDEAMEALNEQDRSALLLRFFENKSLREVGEALGVSEDTAQKRVSRALEKLRMVLGKRRFGLSSVSLSAALSAHAVQSAPAEMVATITYTGSSAAAVVHAISMTTLKKSILGASLAILAGVGLYEAYRLKQETEALRAAEIRSAHYMQAYDALWTKYADLKQLEESKKALRAKKLESEDPEVEAALDAWLEAVGFLRAYIDRNPGLKVPEMKYLTVKDWLAVTQDMKMESELSIRKALGDLRDRAKSHFGPKIAEALRQYRKGNSNQNPDALVQISGYFDEAVDPAILQRYEALSDGKIKGLVNQDGEKILFQEKEPLDPYYDTSHFFTSGGGYGVKLVSKYEQEITTAIDAYRNANKGQAPVSADNLTPYLKSEIVSAFIEEELKRKK